MGSTRYDWLPRSDRAPGGGYLYMGTPLYKVRPVALVIFRARNWSILGLFPLCGRFLHRCPGSRSPPESRVQAMKDRSNIKDVMLENILITPTSYNVYLEYRTIPLGASCGDP